MNRINEFDGVIPSPDTYGTDFRQYTFCKLFIATMMTAHFRANSLTLATTGRSQRCHRANDNDEVRRIFFTPFAIRASRGNDVSSQYGVGQSTP